MDERSWSRVLDVWSARPLKQILPVRSRCGRRGGAQEAGGKLEGRPGEAGSALKCG